PGTARRGAPGPAGAAAEHHAADPAPPGTGPAHPEPAAVARASAGPDGTAHRAAPLRAAAGPVRGGGGLPGAGERRGGRGGGGGGGVLRAADADRAPGADAVVRVVGLDLQHADGRDRRRAGRGDAAAGRPRDGQVPSVTGCLTTTQSAVLE